MMTQRSGRRASAGARLGRARRVAAARPDVLLFTCSAAIVAVHAAVDSFLAPEPGTGPENHLVRGSASLAMLVWRSGLPRVRPGARAAIAAALGVLALEGAASRSRRSRGRCAGRGLDRLPTRPGRTRAAGARRSVALALAEAGRVSLCPSRHDRARDARGGLRAAPAARHRDPRDPPPRAAVAPAELGRASEDVTLRTSDGLDLAAWYVPSLNGAAVISYPDPAGEAAAGADAGPARLRRAAARRTGLRREQGDPNVFGWAGEKDIGAAVAWLGDGRTSKRAGSAASGSRSAAR